MKTKNRFDSYDFILLNKDSEGWMEALGGRRKESEQTEFQVH